MRLHPNCNQQVDFCPFRGPDAPLCAPKYYHEKSVARTLLSARVQRTLHAPRNAIRN